MKTKSTARIVLGNIDGESIDSFIRRALVERKALKPESFFDIKAVYNKVTFIATINSTKDSLYADYASKAGEPVDGYVGEHVTEYCKRLVKMRGKIEANFTAQFNGSIITVTKESTVKSLQSDFQTVMDKNAEKYRNSNEYKEQQVRQNNKADEKIAVFNRSMILLSALDFKDYNLVLTWLNIYCDVIDYIPALEKEPKMTSSRTEVATIFKDKGYLVNVNCGADFKKDNEENFAYYLIGQVLSFLERGSPVPQVFGSMYEDYKNKFKIK